MLPYTIFVASADPSSTRLTISKTYVLSDGNARLHFSYIYIMQHQRTHAPRTIECPGCPQMFDRDSAMILHLEAGSCPSGTNSDDVDEIAFRCYQSQRYTSDHPEFDFCCPGCGAEFLYMSGVLQHAESNACAVGLGKRTVLGKFLYFLCQQIDE